MGLEFIDRTIRTSVATGIVISLAVWSRFGLAPAGAFAAGCAWSLVNIRVIRALVGLVVVGAEKDRLRTAALLVVKLPVLYGIGFLLLLWGHLPVGGLLAGFAWPLVVVVLKAAGRLILGLDRKDTAAVAVEPVDARKRTLPGSTAALPARKDG